VVTDYNDLFKFWLAEGYRFRRRTNTFMQEDPKAYKVRLHSEYEIISSIPGYVDYFLMVSDLVRWAKDQGIAVGPGRGSAAGSLCCYLLRITELDPLQYPMLFERFISPDRPDLPDIDIDFEDERRAEVVRYAQEKYGMDRVANILNFVRYKGANSLNDIGTVYRIPEWKIESIKDKLVDRPEGHPRFSKTLRDTIDNDNNVAEIVASAKEIELACDLEGNYRHTSIHPAAIVISSVPLTDITATYEKQSGSERGSGVAFDKKDSAYLGLLKIDFLSLRALTAIRASLDAIGMTMAEFYEIPLDDPKVYERFRAADVLGIFQFEGYTTKRVLKQVAPTKFMDLVDVNALSRPGGDDKAYIKAKQTGKIPPSCSELVAQHINWTYGTIVYQEQILLILRDLGNFPPSDVNAVRKIISDKQDSSLFNEYLERFVEGAATHGVTRDEATGVWTTMVQATGYAFNISHAACYSDTAYRQMWLKVYHPEFYLGQLLKCPDDDEGKEKRRRLIMEANSKNITVFPPNLEHSQQGWSLANGHLYAGFTAIKGVGGKIANDVVAWRDNNHEFLRTWGYDSWDSLVEVPGIGPGRVQTIKDFVYHDDPFGVRKVARALESIHKDFENDEFPGIEAPTHKSVDITTGDDFVVFMGVLKRKTYKDVVEQRLKYGADGLTRERILEDLDSPHLLKYVTLECVDEYDEPVRIRIGRKKFPQYQGLISRARVNRDVILVRGYVSEFGGIAIQTSDLVVIDPEG